jgi:double-strand break repair protein MRE11
LMDDEDDDAPAPPPNRAQPARTAAKPRQTKLNFSQKLSTQKAIDISDDEISDDDAFESVPPTRSTRKR